MDVAVCCWCFCADLFRVAACGIVVGWDFGCGDFVVGGFGDCSGFAFARVDMVGCLFWWAFCAV